MEQNAGTARGSRYFTSVVLLVAVLGAIGIAIKAPFGRQLMHVGGAPAPLPHDRSAVEWLFQTEWGWLLLITVAGLCLYRFAGFTAAPWIERTLLRNDAVPKPRILVPALVVSLLITLLMGVGLLAGGAPPIAKQIVSGAAGADDTWRLFALWPLGFAGAGLSEEVLYRFGMITPVVGLACLLLGRDRPGIATAAFWAANIAQAFLFGLGHVQDGVVASAAGGWFVATLAAPQTWVGLLFGYVYRRWGIETAIVAHMLTDIFAPAAVLAWAYFTL